MSKRYSGKSFKDSSVMKKPKLSLKEKRKMKRENLNMGKKIFCFKRTSLDKKQVIYNITNLSSKYHKLNLDNKFIKYKNLLGKLKINRKFELQPYETVWLSNQN